MRYTDAKKLHNDDEVMVKGTDKSLYVVEIEHDAESKDVFIRCDDGILYHHTALK
jgi:hypothetical protein